MNDELITQIEDLGLSEKEARVYVANLMLGPATVQKIADQAAIKRVTTYVILESLSGLGLVSQTSQGKKTFFTAEDPMSLRRLLDKKEQQIKEQKAGFESILPDLQSLRNLPSDSPNVKFYDSAEGIRSIFGTFFATYRDEIDMVRGISNLDQLHSFYPEMREQKANPERVKLKVPSRFIYTSTRGPIYKETDKEALRESRWLPPEKYPLNGDINIIGDYVVMLALSGTKPIGIVIKSHELAQGLKAFFELAWEAAEKYNK
jgi:HTH-type transcriptional regulator, sugar sensing transcriptional regulator